jgi:two-component system chemotaxis response regulator CheY
VSAAPSRTRILIVDDASLVRAYYRDALRRGLHDIDEALNGLEALEKLLFAPADLVILDINMPKMDGMTFLRALRRQSPPLAATPVLVTSTQASPHDAALAREAGANFYLTKPVTQETLLTYVALMCGAPE